ncbi:C39 family peptidase [Candidatus Falkowbacteria bacterium]|jgi:hypothetical protein|nr:C39 family peptidase [Candidatus Falkowbacteria bacterium]MBT7007684.1 C39 family peptidase [Candidatus Falkowbacteria bacterium]
MKQLFILILLVFSLTACTNESENFVVEESGTNDPKIEETELQDENDAVEISNDEDVEPADQVEDPVLEENLSAAMIDLDVPFQSQAPHRNWGMPYQEACEEAVLILAHRYFNNQTITADQMDEEIKSVVDWQMDKFGSYTDTSLAEVDQIAREYYNLNTEITDDISLDNIKNQLADGNLVIVPTAGRLLGNPYYSNLGPIYHYILIRGYDGDQFITNDVGIMSGRGYKFKFKTVLNAIHDLPEDENDEPIRLYEADMTDEQKAMSILRGEARILIIKK